MNSTHPKHESPVTDVMEIFAEVISMSSTPSSPTKKPEEITKNRTSQEPPYKVILHNDDFTPMERVIDVLKKVIPNMSFKQATNIMLEAHKNGKAVVIKCHRELAELYQEGLVSGGLISSIEPD